MNDSRKVGRMNGFTPDHVLRIRVAFVDVCS